MYNRQRAFLIKKVAAEKKAAATAAAASASRKKMPAVLGPRGYCLLKSDMTDSEQEYIRKKLTVSPTTMTIGSGSQVIEYPAYRESATRFYLPRHYAEPVYGPADTVTLGDGDTIADDIIFCGELRQEQFAPVELFMERIAAACGGGCLELPCGFGKTTISLNIFARLRRKTIVIVNKEYLLNQWVKRIQEFLPNARIGRLQCDRVEIEDKDIVIGMLQSIAKRNYPTGTFASFGLSIFDEVHHMSSEVFSGALFKLVTKYTLGLSATMDRKDGTTFIFKYFLGDTIFSTGREEEHDVEVRALQYVVNDAEFNKTETNTRGEPMYSTMVSKLCDYTPRCEFIVKTVRELVAEYPQKQILILAHNKSLIKYLQEKLTEIDAESVGLYVGGMKQHHLDASSAKKIIIGTYSMASEGLDIKTLSALVLATPKTDIVQVVGRILRLKDNSPIVIDIVDKHDLFQNQWRKRRAYYKKCNYRIRIVKMANTRQINASDAMNAMFGGGNSGEYSAKKICDDDDDDSDDDDDDDQPRGICTITR